MDSIQLTRALNMDNDIRSLFRGVFAADNLPINCSHPSALIVNTDPLRKSGSHWVAIFIDGKGRGEFFDSYGLPPIVKEHLIFLDRECTSWRYSAWRLQSLTSAVCGNYASVYLAFRCTGFSPTDFFKLFTNENYSLNDETILRVFKEIFGNRCQSFAINYPLFCVQTGKAATTTTATCRLLKTHPYGNKGVSSLPHLSPASPSLSPPCGI